MRLSDSLQEKFRRVHGERADAWLADFPSILSECKKRWDLDFERPFDNLSYHFVIRARTNRTEVVLKLGVPSEEFQREMSALAFFGGLGAVRLLDCDTRRGALLMERANPGTPIYLSCTDDEATGIAATLMRRLWRDEPSTHSFPSLVRWFKAFEQLRHQFHGSTGPFAEELITKAERMFIDLEASTQRRCILHGDLHHENILSSRRDDWLAIDPKGLCGDPGYEVSSFMLNQLPHLSTDSAVRNVLENRLAIFAEELEISQPRLARWSFCHAVVSALWDFEEQCDPGKTLRVATILGALIAANPSRI
jgi:streptomycin 6-kinase